METEPPASQKNAPSGEAKFDIIDTIAWTSEPIDDDVGDSKNINNLAMDDEAGSYTSEEEDSLPLNTPVRESTRLSAQGSGRIHKCKDCDYTSKRGDQLKVHMAKAHGNGQMYKCDDCDYKTARKDTMQRHIMKIHLKDN